MIESFAAISEQVYTSRVERPNSDRNVESAAESEPPQEKADQTRNSSELASFVNHAYKFADQMQELVTADGNMPVDLKSGTSPSITSKQDLLHLVDLSRITCLCLGSS